jgi:predicted small metal-binding protein
MKKVVRCYCGFVAEGDEEALVRDVQAHVRDVHHTEYTRDEVLAIAEPVG